MHTHRVRFIVPLLLVVAVTALIVASRSSPASAAAGDGGFVDHPSLVPDTPESDYPIILDTPTFLKISPNCPDGCEVHRQTRAVDLIGDYIISGGDFQNIELQNGQVVAQQYLAIFDVRSKQLVCTNLDVNNEVRAIAPGPEHNTAILGGRFSSINGADGIDRTRSRLAKVDLDTCLVDTAWSSGYLDAKVTELAVSGDRLFVGGDFTEIDGENIERLAELNLSSGAINTAFDFAFGGETTRTVVGMEANPAGTRLAIVHRASSIAGQNMRGTAIFNIANPSTPFLTNHRLSPNSVAHMTYRDIQDGAIAPDFSAIGIVEGTATQSDYVTLVPTVEAPNQLSWQHFMRDSIFGIGISNNAVYVAGHFCRIEAGPGPTATMAPNSGPSGCTGSEDFNDGAWRTQMAALSLADGTPLTWNPGSNANRGATAVTVVSRGLLVGFDADRSNNIRIGTTAFYDFGGADDPRADQACSAAVDATGQIVDLSWDSVAGVDSYIVRRNSKWLASPGDVTSYTDTSAPNGVHTYFIRTFLDGEQWDTQCEPAVTISPTGPPTQTCAATTNADGSVTLAWSAIAGESSYIVRRNSSWLGSPGNVLTYTDTSASPGDTYVIRSRMDGVTTNTTCTTDGDPPDQTCTATDVGNGSIMLMWSAIDGETSYQVRRNGAWLASPGNVLTYTDTGSSPGDTYIIRSRIAGVTTNTDCL